MASFAPKELLLRVDVTLEKSRQDPAEIDQPSMSDLLSIRPGKVGLDGDNSEREALESPGAFG